MNKHQSQHAEANNNSSSSKKPNFYIIEGDSRSVLRRSIDKQSIDICFTSPEPPYNTQEMDELIDVMLAVYPLIKPTGSIWVHLADVHNIAGDMALIPERFVMTMVNDYNWHLRNKLIWYDPNDRAVNDITRFRRDYQFLYWFVKKNPGYYFRREESGGNTSIILAPYIEPRPNTFESGFPESLIETAIVATCPDDGTVLDPFCGTGTTGKVALEYGCSFVGIERKHELIRRITDRLAHDA